MGMERRHAKRLSGVCEVTLTDDAGAMLARGSIADLSEGGLLITYIPPPELARLAVGRQIRFHFCVPTGDVAGAAEIVRKGEEDVGLRIRSVDNEAGLPHLMSFLHSWFCGVD
jgi:hypothetical protein